MSEKSQDMREKALCLMEALSQVDEELLVRSERKGSAGTAAGPLIFFRRYGRLIAACFAFVVLGTCFFGVYTVVFMRAGSADSTAWQLTGKEAPAENAAAYDNRNGAGGVYGASGADNAGGMNGTAGSSGSDGMNGTGNGDGMDGVNDLSGMKEQANAGFGEESQRDQGTSVSSESQKFQDTDNKNTETAMEVLPDKQDNLMIDESGCLSDSRKEITLEEALKDESLGGYIPASVPAGYKISSVRQGAPDTSNKELSLTWERGMDSIMLYITDYYAIVKGMQGENQLTMADISRPETYDVRMYEIPYGDTVPEEYRTVFENPVFRSSELSLELVEARMKSVLDMGDTDTPRGNFSVLYDSGVLIRFNGRGTAGEIWEMFQSIDKP